MLPHLLNCCLPMKFAYRRRETSARIIESFSIPPIIGMTSTEPRGEMRKLFSLDNYPTVKMECEGEIDFDLKRLEKFFISCWARVLICVRTRRIFTVDRRAAAMCAMKRRRWWVVRAAERRKLKLFTSIILTVNHVERKLPPRWGRFAVDLNFQISIFFLVDVLSIVVKFAVFLAIEVIFGTELCCHFNKIESTLLCMNMRMKVFTCTCANLVEITVEI